MFGIGHKSISLLNLKPIPTWNWGISVAFRGNTCPSSFRFSKKRWQQADSSSYFVLFGKTENGESRFENIASLQVLQKY